MDEKDTTFATAPALLPRISVYAQSEQGNYNYFYHNCKNNKYMIYSYIKGILSQRKGTTDSAGDDYERHAFRCKFDKESFFPAVPHAAAGRSFFRVRFCLGAGEKDGAGGLV